MSNDARQTVALARKKIREAARANPSALVYSEAIKIVSAFEVGRDGVMKRGAGEDVLERYQSDVAAADAKLSSPKLGTSVEVPEELLKTMRLTYAQKRLDSIAMWQQKEGYGIDQILLKARSVGFTYYVVQRMVSRACTTGGFSNLIVAHKKDSVRQILRIVSGMIENLPKWLAVYPINDAADLIRLESAFWGLIATTIRCIHSSDIGQARGDRTGIILRDEDAFYENPEEVQRAMGSLGLRTKMFEKWRGSSGNGMDKNFSGGFLEPWNAQGQRNLWEKGAKRGKHPSVASFFPFYYDIAQSSLDLHAEVTEEDLYGTLNDYEKMLLEQHLKPFWDEYSASLPANLQLSPAQKRTSIAKVINWRRAKLPQRDGWLTRPTAGVNYTIETAFSQEHPITVQEALHTESMRVVLRKEIPWMQEQVREPILTCNISSPDFDPQASPLSGENRMLIYKPREHVTGSLYAFFDGAEGVAGGDSGVVDLSKDATYCTFMEYLYDPQTGEGYLEQVGSYMTQLPTNISNDDLFRFCMYWNKGRSPKNWVMFGGNILYGNSTYDYFLHKKYPPARLIQRHSEDSILASGSGMKWGYTESKRGTIAGASYLVNWLGRHKLFIRDARTVQQAAFFVEKENGKIEALHKKKGGETSKDDCVDVYVGFLNVFTAFQFEKQSINAQINRDKTQEAVEKAVSTSFPGAKPTFNELSDRFIAEFERRNAEGAEYTGKPKDKFFSAFSTS